MQSRLTHDTLQKNVQPGPRPKKTKQLSFKAQPRFAMILQQAMTQYAMFRSKNPSPEVLEVFTSNEQQTTNGIHEIWGIHKI